MQNTTTEKRSTEERSTEATDLDSYTQAILSVIDKNAKSNQRLGYCTVVMFLAPMLVQLFTDNKTPGGLATVCFGALGIIATSTMIHKSSNTNENINVLSLWRKPHGGMSAILNRTANLDLENGDSAEVALLTSPELGTGPDKTDLCSIQ